MRQVKGMSIVADQICVEYDDGEIECGDPTSIGESLVADAGWSQVYDPNGEGIGFAAGPSFVWPEED